MPRQLRVQFQGAIYHVTIRGNGRADIFVDNHDRERFLKRLEDSLGTYTVPKKRWQALSVKIRFDPESPESPSEVTSNILFFEFLLTGVGNDYIVHDK